MSVTIDISAETAARLAQQAQVAGTDVVTYVERLVSEAAAVQSLDEQLAPIREAFAASGMTDAELIDLLTEAQSDYRRELASRT